MFLAAFDEANLILYVTIFQVFRIWLIPFYYAPVTLTSVLTLEHDEQDGKYYIASQNDLYQVDQWIRFVAPGGWVLVHLWHYWAMFFCLLGAIVLRPISLLEERWGMGSSGEVEWDRKKRMGHRDGMSGQEMLEKTELKGKILGSQIRVGSFKS
jgi:hypothetical protein